jgi:hypothetical protein
MKAVLTAAPPSAPSTGTAWAASFCETTPPNLGGRGPVQADAPAGNAAESGYFAVRGALAKAMSEAAK